MPTDIEINGFIQENEMNLRKLLCKWFHIGCDPTGPADPPPTPGGSRPGIMFGYYGTQAGDAAATADHVTMTHIGAWGDWVTPQGRINLLNDIVGFAKESMAAGITRLMFTCDWCLYTQTNPRRLLPNATSFNYLVEFFDRLRAEGLTPYAFYPIDEPNIHENAISAADQESANNLLRDVANVYEWRVPLAVIFGAQGGSYPGVSFYDWCGMDNYGAPIFSDGEYDNLRNQLTPAQKTIVVPGGCDPWRENPDPFYGKAQQDTKVAMIMPFKWFGTDGIGVNGMAPAYRAVGVKIKAAP